MNSDKFKKLGFLVLIVIFVTTLSACDAAEDDWETIESAEDIDTITVDYGTLAEEILINRLPEEIELTLDDGSEVEGQVSWMAPEDYDGTKPGTYEFEGTAEYDGVSYDEIRVDVFLSNIANPYSEIEWGNIEFYEANLHTHTTYSDGIFDPHEVVDKYQEANYDILALTDHDTDHYEARPLSLYPWQEFNEIYDEIKNEQHGRFEDKTFGEYANEEWENRNPQELNMVAIEGSEISYPHHLGSYFNNYAGGPEEVETALAEIEARNGLAVLFHPGRYDYDHEWYVNFYQEYDNLVGVEVYNRNDIYPEDRELWDEILAETMPEREVWGFANDDMHFDYEPGEGEVWQNDFAWNRNIFPLEDLTEENVRSSMEDGSFYFYRPAYQEQEPSFYLDKVIHDKNSITLETSKNVDEIKWITHREEKDNVVLTGQDVSLDDIPEEKSFIRAKLIRGEEMIYTQPFGIRD